MTPAQVLIADLVATLLIGTLAGVIWRGRLSSCWPFSVLLILSMTTNRLVVWWPEAFHTRQFWMSKEIAFAALQMLVVLDLCGALCAWPRARRVSIIAVSCVIVATLVFVLSVDARGYEAQLGVLIARVNIGAAWAFAALVGVVWWFVLPLSPFVHRIVVGSTLHLSFYGALLASVDWLGWRIRPLLDALDPAVYAATLGIWMFAAWRLDGAPEEHAQAVARP